MAAVISDYSRATCRSSSVGSHPPCLAIRKKTTYRGDLLEVSSFKRGSYRTKSLVMMVKILDLNNLNLLPNILLLLNFKKF